MNWQLTSAQFMHLWEATGLDVMPHPFEHRTDARLENELQIERDRLDRWRVEQADDSRVETAVGILRRPDLSVSAYSPGERPLLRRGVLKGRFAVVAEQVPAVHGTGDLHIRVHEGRQAPDVAKFAADLLEGVPSCPPGRTAAVDVHPDDLRAGHASANVLHSAAMPAADLFKHIVARRTAAGYLCVHSPWEGAHDTILDSATWIDVADDGRYLHYTDHLVRLRSTTSADMADHLERRVRAALAR